MTGKKNTPMRKDGDGSPAADASEWNKTTDESEKAAAGEKAASEVDPATSPLAKKRRTPCCS